MHAEETKRNPDKYSGLHSYQEGFIFSCQTNTDKVFKKKSHTKNNFALFILLYFSYYQECITYNDIPFKIKSLVFPFTFCFIFKLYFKVFQDCWVRFSSFVSRNNSNSCKVTEKNFRKYICKSKRMSYCLLLIIHAFFPFYHLNIDSFYCF